MNNIHGQRLNEDLLSPKGSGYEGNRAPDFCLTRDRWSQIINLQYGPDGQMYMIDWYDANACHHRDPNGHDRTNGRIFKVSYGDAKAATGRPAETQRRRTGRVATERQRLARPPRAANPARARRQGRSPSSSWPRWPSSMPTRPGGCGRCGHCTSAGGLDERRIATGLANDYAARPRLDDPTGDRRRPRKLPSDACSKLAALAANDPSPVVRLYVASAAAAAAARRRAGTLVAGLLAHAEDAGDHNLPLMYWYAAEPLAEVDAGPGAGGRGRGSNPAGICRSWPAAWPSSARPRRSTSLVERLRARRTRPIERDAPGRHQPRACEGRRQVPMPSGWSAVSARLVDSADAEVNAQATALALTFGDPAALAKLRGVLVDAAGRPGGAQAGARRAVGGAKIRELAADAASS